MSSPYTQKYVLPQLQRFFWAPEVINVLGTQSGTAGKAPLAATGGATGAPLGWWEEPCDSLVTALNVNNYEAREWIGMPVDLIDIVRVTEHAAITVRGPYRASSFHAFALASMMGDSVACGTTDNVAAGSGIWTGSNHHPVVPGINGARCGTFAISHDTGAITSTKGDNSLLMTYGTVASVKLTFTPEAPLMCETQVIAGFPVTAYNTALASSTAGFSAAPTGATEIGPLLRMLSYQGTFGLYSGSGAANYAAATMTGDLSIARQTAAFFTSSQNSQFPYDIQSGALAVVGNFNMLFDSLQSGTLFNDFLTDQKVGATGHVNTIQYGPDANKNGFSVSFQPGKWTTPPSFSGGGGQNRGMGQMIQATLTGYHDGTNTTTITTPSVIDIYNNISVGMIA